MLTRRDNCIYPPPLINESNRIHRTGYNRSPAMWNETSYPKQVVKELCARMNERKGNGWTVKRFKIFSMDFVSPTLLPFFRRKFAGYTRFTSHPPFHTRNTRVYTPSGQVHPTSSPRENRRLDECWQSRIVLLGFKVSPRDRALITFPRTIHILLFGGKLFNRSVNVPGYDGNLWGDVCDGSIRATFINVVTKGGNVCMKTWCFENVTGGLIVYIWIGMLKRLR